ncbi:hypothetical protein DPX16_15844 [Anabarilius grahami]|uniref:Uncharacterized protein n=1 Tax=Anabarilius grahami TaxID=495550 RepID=A0A3N0YUZ4_ANAGA|nr:hypothetical protein DPX16_15844 [Anabarilius grahami]
MSAVLPKLSPTSPALPPLSPLSDVVTSRAYCEPPPSGCEDPVAPPPASDHVFPPRPVALIPPPVLLPPSTSAGTFERSASLSSLGPSASPESDVASPSPRTCSSPLLSGPPLLQLRLALPSLRLRLRLHPRSLQLHLSPPDPCIYLRGSSPPSLQLRHRGPPSWL